MDIRYGNHLLLLVSCTLGLLCLARGNELYPRKTEHKTDYDQLKALQKRVAERHLEKEFPDVTEIVALQSYNLSTRGAQDRLLPIRVSGEKCYLFRNGEGEYEWIEI